MWCPIDVNVCAAQAWRAGCIRFVNLPDQSGNKSFFMKLFRTSAIILMSVAALQASAQISNSTGGGKIINTVTTAVPFLRIIPDARSGAMGDLGISLSPDANGWFHNPAKMAFIDKHASLAFTYTPWLQQLVNDIYLASIYGSYRIDDMQTVGASLRYFSLGTIQFTNAVGQNTGEFRPNEFAVDFGYARKLSDVFSIGSMLRFIYSNLATGQEVAGQTIKPGTAAAADVSFQYRNTDLKVSGIDSELGVGLSFTNIGSKITYTDNALNKDFIPANFGLGTSLNMELDDYNSLMFAVDVNKLMVPTPDSLLEFKNQSVPSSIINSWADAPDGFSEELREFTFAVGAEYWYDKQFAVRAGYFNEHVTKGGRKFLTVGLGLKYNVFGLNFSYLVPTTNQRNPLDNTLRFTLLFDFADAKDTH